MKVALVQAPVFDLKTPSNGLALISAHVRRDGHSVTVRDSNLAVAGRFKAKLATDFNDARTWHPIADRYEAETDALLDAEADLILKGGPDVVAFSVLSRAEKWSFVLAEKIKAREPRARVVFGGPACLRENLAFDFIAHPAVDAVALSEADLTFPRFLKGLDLGSRACAPAPGMLVKKDGRVVDGGDPPVVEDLDSLPFLDFAAFTLDDYSGMLLYLSTTRGCVRKCSFCTHIVGQKTYRTMSAVRTVAEIRHQMDIHPRRDTIEFCDSLVNGNVRRLGEMADLLVDYRLERVAKRRTSNWDFGWSGMAIIHRTMTPALLRRLKLSGCIQLRYGIESGSQKVLDSMQKNVLLSDAETVIRDTRAAGIQILLFILVGFPTETEADFQATLDFLTKHAKDLHNVHFSACEIQKGSHLDEHPEVYGLKHPFHDRLRWETLDGRNTYAIREERMRRMESHIKMLGLGAQEVTTRLGATLGGPEPEYAFYH